MNWKSKISVTTCLFVGLILSFQNCGKIPITGMEPFKALEKKPNATADSVSAADLKSLYEQIEFLNNSDLSCSTNDDCGVIALGSRACGGPQKNLVGSLRNSRHQEILELAEHLRESEAAFNREHGVVSICSLLDTPNTSCDAGKCAVVQR